MQRFKCKSSAGRHAEDVGDREHSSVSCRTQVALGTSLSITRCCRCDGLGAIWLHCKCKVSSLLRQLEVFILKQSLIYESLNHSEKTFKVGEAGEVVPWVRALAVNAEGPEFKSLASVQKLSMAVWACNPCTGIRKSIGPQEGYHEKLLRRHVLKHRRYLGKNLDIEKVLVSFGGYYFLICRPSQSQPPVPPQPPRSNVQPIATLEVPSCYEHDRPECQLLCDVFGIS